MGWANEMHDDLMEALRFITDDKIHSETNRHRKLL